jgi:hypothetical protein
MIFFISQFIFVCRSPHFSLIAFILELSRCLRVRCHDSCSTSKGILNRLVSLIFISDHFCIISSSFNLFMCYGEFYLFVCLLVCNRNPYFRPKNDGFSEVIPQKASCVNENPKRHSKVLSYARPRRMHGPSCVIVKIDRIVCMAFIGVREQKGKYLQPIMSYFAYL